MALNSEKLTFLRGVLAAFASVGHRPKYEEVRRLCRLNKEQIGEYLGEARCVLRPGEPDFCAIVVNESGQPGHNWGDLSRWPTEVARAEQFWRDRAAMNNTEFEQRHGALPSIPQ